MYSCERCKKSVCVVNPALTCSDMLKSNHCYFSHAFIDFSAGWEMGSNTAKCSNFPRYILSYLISFLLQISLVSLVYVYMRYPWRFWCYFGPAFFCLDSLHPPETIPTRGHVLVQDQQPRVLPAGGPRHATLPGQREPIPSHNLWSAVSYLSSWHGRKYDFSFISSIKIQLQFPLVCRIAESKHLEVLLEHVFAFENAFLSCFSCTQVDTT